MFTWLSKQGVESDEGFAFQFVDRFSAEYREPGRKLMVEVQDAFVDGKPAVQASCNCCATWHGEHAVISRDDQDRIIDNIRGACEFQGLRFAVSD